MTPLGTALFVALLLGLVAGILAEVRRGRLYVGYAVVCLVLVVAAIAVISLPPLAAGFATVVHSVFPRSGVLPALIVMAGFAGVYVLVQVSILSNRIAAVIQDLAIARAEANSDGAAPPDTAEVGRQRGPLPPDPG